MTANGTIRRAYADTPYGQLHYRYAGEGQPLLLIHQTATSSMAYEPVIPFLASSYRVLAVDTPGFGMSDRPTHQYTFSEYGRCFAAFLQSLNIQCAAVYGHHTGASFACELAAAYPEMVNKLILDATPYWEDPPEQFLKNLKPIVLKDDGSHIMEVWQDLSSRIEPFFPRPYSQEMLRTLHWEVLWKLVAGERYHEAYIALGNYDIMSRLPLIQAPTLVMAGEKDSLRRTMEAVTAKLQRARTYVGPGGSYLKTYENPEALARTIMDFLDSPGV